MEQKYLPVGVLEEISKISQNSQGRARCGVHLYYSCSLEYLTNQKTQSKSYSVNFIKRATPKERLLNKYFPVNLEKIVSTTFSTYYFWNNVKERASYLEFSYVFFINKCSSLRQNNIEHFGGAS